jgi:anaerobic ribonucleoside-triphosphate reductase activating protein
VAVPQLVNAVLEAHGREPLEGITFSGGEPMQQAGALVAVMTKVRSAAPRLSFGMFTGYAESELAAGTYFAREATAVQEKRELWRRIRGLLDFAVMGRYNQALPSREPLRTSRNQKLVLFTGRYRESDFGPQLVEISIDSGGKATLTGFPILGVLLNAETSRLTGPMGDCAGREWR